MNCGKSALDLDSAGFFRYTQWMNNPDLSLTKILLVFAATLMLANCSQIKTRKDIEQGPPQVVKVPGTSPHARVEGDPAPAPIAAQPKVALVLGPGGYRTLVHAQVVKELVQAKIPIQKVVGIEWGALAGAFFALDGKAHEGEWKLYKLDSSSLESKSFFSKKAQPQDTSVLQKYLKENLGNRDLSSLTIKFTCPQLSLKSGAVLWAERGSLAESVENCLAFPPRWTPVRNSVAAVLSTQEAVDNLRREGYNVIILVNVLGDSDLLPNSDRNERLASDILWLEARRDVWAAKSKATDVVEIRLRGSIYDLDSRKTWTTQAERAAREAVRNLSSKYGF